jgi:hypothetical protein
MMNRTTSRTVTFAHPFVVDGLDEPHPAGSYTVETAEELLQGLSFPAWRRLYTTIRLPGRPGTLVLQEMATIDPEALDAAVARDAAADLKRTIGLGHRQVVRPPH